MRSTVSQRQAQGPAEFKRQHEQEEQQGRDQVIAEFGGDMNALAGEILYYRRAAVQLADAANRMTLRAPFSMPPGPYWVPRPVPATDDHETDE
jgi:hypothetical protein